MNGEDAEVIKAGTRELTEAMNALAQAAQSAGASQQQNPAHSRLTTATARPSKPSSAKRTTNKSVR